MAIGTATFMLMPAVVEAIALALRWITWIAHLDCPQVAHLDAQGMAGEANCLLLQGGFENQFLWLCHRTV